MGSQAASGRPIDPWGALAEDLDVEPSAICKNMNQDDARDSVRRRLLHS